MMIDEFTARYHSFVSGIIDEKGVYPQPMIVLSGDDTIGMFALMVSPEQIMELFWSIVLGTHESIPDPRAVLVGLDRWTEPGQGTEFADVLTCALWVDQPGRSFFDSVKSIKVGVINYQHEPRIVRPWDWDNKHWTDQMTYDLVITAMKITNESVTR